MKLLLLSLMALTVAFGCKKPQPTETPPTPAPENASTPAPANGNSPANQAAPSQAPAAPTIDTTKVFADVNTALKGRDYQKATDTLLAIQRQTALTEQQAAAVRAQMVQLQGAVASGVASGDPNAKAAADRLRASASGN